MRYIQIKNEDGNFELVPADRFVKPERKAPYVMGDLEPYRPVGGPEAKKFLEDPKNARLIGGRRQHREYLRRNGFQEVGNELRPADVIKNHGKTDENYKRFHDRKYRGYNVTEMAKETPVSWKITDRDRERLRK